MGECLHHVEGGPHEHCVQKIPVRSDDLAYLCPSLVPAHEVHDNVHAAHGADDAVRPSLRSGLIRQVNRGGHSTVPRRTQCIEEPE